MNMLPLTIPHLLFFVILLGGCTDQRPEVRGAATLESAVRQALICNPPPDSWQIKQIRPWRSGFIVLFTVTCPSGPGETRPIPKVGSVFVEQEGVRWTQTAYSAFGFGAAPPAEQRITRSSFAERGTVRSGPFTITYGQALTPEVAMVEATLKNGAIVRDEVKHGVFAILTDASAPVTELRVLGPNGDVLRTEGLQEPN